MVAFGASTLAHLAAGKERLMQVTALVAWPPDQSTEGIYILTALSTKSNMVTLEYVQVLSQCVVRPRPPAQRFLNCLCMGSLIYEYLLSSMLVSLE